jgi:heat shock protein HslJ
MVTWSFGALLALVDSTAGNLRSAIKQSAICSCVRLLVLLGIVAVSLAAPQRVAAQDGERCFPETGFCISGEIRAYWEQNGGLAVFGLPLGPQQEAIGEDGQRRQTQWFERHRLEVHPENAAPYNVLLGRLGVDRLVQDGRDWQAFPQLDPNNADAERCAFFAETNHQVCDEFLAAFRANGLSFANTPGISREESLALFGLPISEAMTETIEGEEFTVQWFERARFELHPDNQPPFNVLFGRLGAELGGGTAVALENTEWQLLSFGTLAAPTPAVADSASTLTLDGNTLFGSTGCNRFRGPYTANATTLTVGPVASTLAACTSDALNAQEQAILSALDGEVSYLISANRLQISYDNGQQALTYQATPEPPLVGTNWRLERFGPAEAPTAAAAEPAAPLSFDGARVSGNTGCNTFSGDYSATSDTLTFGPIASTLILCENLAAQEQAILAALQNSVPFQIVGTELQISFDNGQQVLVYRAGS